jgi:fido (protein-threonine AMPylation protein)
LFLKKKFYEMSMTLIHSNFNFLDRPWWKQEYDERDVQFFISNIKILQKAISLSVCNEDELYWKGYIDFHREKYLIECISVECNVDLDVVRQLLKKSWFNIFLNWLRRIMCLGPSRSSRLTKKIKNLAHAIDYIFPPIFYPNLPIAHFTPLLAKQLHQRVGDGLIEDAGQYRTRYVMAAQDNYVYLAPDLIENRIEKLFHQCRENFEKENLELEEAVKFGACFLAHFLDIHPFFNGNGRVAKLLLSYLLSRFTIVPFSLYLGAQTRDVYLDCLREAKWYNETPLKPSALANFILENIYLSSYNICVMMDINIQNDN